MRWKVLYIHHHLLLLLLLLLGDPTTDKGRKWAYCMDEGDCELCVDSCNSTTTPCTCELPDQDCWDWVDCAGKKTIQVGTACKAECTENKTLTETFSCEDASGGQPPVQATVSSLPNSGLKTNCEAVWMYKGNPVTVDHIVAIGEETCSGNCEEIVVDLTQYSVTCQNWNNETQEWYNVSAKEVKHQGACIVECIPSKEITNTQWTYYCYPDNQTTTTTTESKCQVFWHGNDSKIRTIDEINEEINTNDCNGTTLPPEQNTTTPIVTTTTPIPPSTTPGTPEPPNCIGDCQWPPFPDPRGTWDNSSCILTCEPPPGGMIGNITARIPPLNASCT